MRALADAMKVAAWLLVIVLGVAFVASIPVHISIGSGVNEISQSAMAQFPGDRVEALVALVECESCSLHDRNHAVWALGQLKDKRALPVLHKYYIGRPCDHEREICQYEIAKAIRWTEGKSFMLPQLWRLMPQSDRPQATKATSGK